MRKLNLKNAILGSIMGAFVLVGAALVATAQTQEYRDWQQAQAEAQMRYREYQMSQSDWDYRQWQNAQRRAQQLYADYQRASNRYNNNGYYNNSYNNNGYYNNGYNNNGYNNTVYRRYRIYNNGSYYMTDSRGAELLRQAIRMGYEQGYRQGQLDRRYGRGYDLYDEDMYRSGTFGYQSYVARNQYQYYFKQGFQRGYEDGYYSTTRYGYRTGTSLNILGNVLNTILDISQQ
jgi:hypothetical protein